MLAEEMHCPVYEVYQQPEFWLLAARERLAIMRGISRYHAAHPR